MKMNLKAAWVALAVLGGAASAPAAAVPSVALAGTLDFSAEVEDALFAGGVSAAAFAPSLVTGYDALLSADLTLEAGSAGDTIAVGDARASGGWTWQTTPNFTNTGGWLTITDLRIDVATQTIYADASGANGAGSVSNIALWTAQIDAPDLPWDAFTLVPSLPPGETVVLQASGLALTESGRDLLTTSFGLNSVGQTVFNGVGDWGTVTFAITTPVPEPSTWALSALGLAGVAALHRRRRQDAQASA